MALQEHAQDAELSAARSNAALALLMRRVDELEVSQRLTTARLVTLPADTVNLTVEIREEPVEEVIPESPIWDREEESSMDDKEDGVIVLVSFWFSSPFLSNLHFLFSHTFLRFCEPSFIIHAS